MEFGHYLMAEEDREGWNVLLQRHRWCPDDHRGSGTEMR